ncbi:MAG: creatininase family protein [Rhizobiales bacterium]|nr:creatininase family protein [Hyphomicrobiales bacterium]
MIMSRHFAPRAFIWSELTRVELAAKRDAGALVIVPTGSIEQHADHLPVNTDSFLAAAVSQLAAARMTAAEVVVAPVVTAGFSPHHQSFAGTITVRLETFLALLGDTARSILASGFPRVLFVNGHGGNSAPLRALCGQLATDGLAAGMVDYIAPGEKDWLKTIRGGLMRQGHACEQETALMMTLSPADERDRIVAAARDLPARLIQPWIPPGLDEDPLTVFGGGWPPIFQADDCGYYGDPGVATPETGEAALEAIVAALAAFFDAFARTPLRLGTARDPGAPSISPALPPRR